MNQPEPLAAQCEYCIFYDAIGADDRYGFCRVDGPQAVWGDERLYNGVNGLRGTWPVVCKQEWCGRFKSHPDDMQAPPPVPDPPEGVVSTAEDHQAMYHAAAPL